MATQKTKATKKTAKKKTAKRKTAKRKTSKKKTSKKKTQEGSYATIHTVVRLEASPAKAFGLFTNPSALAKWTWAHRAKVVTKVGGAYEVYWLPKSTKDSTAGATITAFAKNRLLAFTWKGPSRFAPYGFMNKPSNETHVTVSFLPSKTGTDVHIVHSGFGKSAEWRKARRFFVEAWSGWGKSLKEISAKKVVPSLELRTVKIDRLRSVAGVVVAGPVIDGQF